MDLKVGPFFEKVANLNINWLVPTRCVTLRVIWGGQAGIPPFNGKNPPYGKNPPCDEKKYIFILTRKRGVGKNPLCVQKRFLGPQGGFLPLKGVIPCLISYIFHKMPVIF